jgi:HPt (histidine-containing phosphotransfer) domain-containing protein
MASNISLLKTIKPALDESLNFILDRIQKCEDGLIPLEQLDISNETQKLKSALSSINKKGLEFGAKLLLNASEGFTDIDSRGWDGMQAQKVLYATKELILQIKNILDNLVNYVEVKSVFLYPYINELNKAMGNIEEISPDQLFEFEVVDQFGKTAYSPKDPEVLKKSMKIFKPYFDKVLESIEQNASQIELQTDITKAIKGLDRFEKIKHRRGYYPFWVLFKARLSLIGIMGDTHDDVSVLKEALFEVRKFVDGQKNPTDGILNELIKPFLVKPLEKHVFMGTPVFKELYEMLTLDTWFEAKEKALNLDLMDQKKDFQLHLNEINEAITLVEQKWASFDELMNQKVKDKRLDNAIIEVNRALDNVYNVKIWLESINVGKALNAISEIRDHLNDIDPTVSLEFARLIHLISSGVNTYNQTKEYKDSIDNQSNRLLLAFQRQNRELEKVQIVDIGKYSQKERLSKAMSLWAEEASVDLKTTENVVKEWLAKPAIIDRLPSVIPLLKNMSGAFDGFQKNKAKAVTDWLIKNLEEAAGGQEILNADKIPLALGSISYYVNFIKKNDFTDDTEQRIFKNALKDLLNDEGEEIHHENHEETDEENSDINENMFNNHIDMNEEKERQIAHENQEDEEIPFNEEEFLETHHEETQEFEPIHHENVDNHDSSGVDEIESNQETSSHEEMESDESEDYFNLSNEAHKDFKEEMEEKLVALDESINNVYELLSTNRKSLMDDQVKEHSINIRRAWHTFKGSSAMAGFTLFSQYSKFMEDTLDEFIESHGSWTIDRIKWLENSVHQAKQYLEELFSQQIKITDDQLISEPFPEDDAISHEPILSTEVEHETESTSAEHDGDLNDIFNLDDEPVVSLERETSPVVVEENQEIVENKMGDIHNRIMDIQLDPNNEVKHIESEQNDNHAPEHENEQEVDENLNHSEAISKSSSVDVEVQHSTTPNVDLSKEKQVIWTEILKKMKLIENTQAEVTQLFIELSKLDTMNL